jgi:hypothetical protein
MFSKDIGYRYTGSDMPWSLFCDSPANADKLKALEEYPVRSEKKIS